MRDLSNYVPTPSRVGHRSSSVFLDQTSVSPKHLIAARQTMTDPRLQKRGYSDAHGDFVPTMENDPYIVSRQAAYCSRILRQSIDSHRVKTEPVKTEPVKTEPVKTEPVKTEPAKV